MADPGEGAGGGGGPGPPYFQTKLRPEGRKKFFDTTPLPTPPLSQGLDPVLYTVKKERGRKYSNDQSINRKRGKYRLAF